MTSEDIKSINFQVYNNETTKLIKKFDWIWIRKKDIDNAFSLFLNNEEAKVLELGCFNWREYSYISEKTNNYLWIDISKNAINYANEKYNNNCFIVWDFEEYKFEWTFDIIFAFASLIHSDIDTMKNIFKKLYNILNKWWIFYVSMKSSSKYKKVVKNDEFWNRIYYYYSLNEFKEIGWKYFTIMYEDEQEFNNQKWITLGFRKEI